MSSCRHLPSLLILTLLFLSSLGVPLLQAEPWHEPAPTGLTQPGGGSSTVSTVEFNWSAFWQDFKTYAQWDLEWFNGVSWVSVKSSLSVVRGYPEANREKLTLIFDALYAGNYRLTFAINKAVKEYVAKTGNFQYELTYDDVVLAFDWSDCAHISGLQFSHGVKDNLFWFRISRNGVQRGAHLVIDPSTVATSTAQTATKHSFQRKIFFANTRFWIFYSDGTNILYKTSINGTIWSPSNVTRSGAGGEYFAIWFDGTYVHYAYAGYYLRYRRGTPNSDGTITWSAAEQTVTMTDDPFKPSITVDSSGYVWVAYYASLVSKPRIIKSGNNDGTWGSTPAGFPYELSTTTSANWMASVVALTSGKMYAVYSRNGVAGLGKLWNGTAWSSEETTMSDSEYGYGHSLVANSDDVYIVFLHNTLATGIRYNKRTYGVGWGVESTVQTNAANLMTPVLSIDTYNGDLYCFWGGSPTTDHVYYKKCVSGTWDINPTDWIDETVDDLKRNDAFNCFYQKYSFYIGVSYITKIVSPYNVRFNFLEVHYTYAKTASQAISVAAQNTRAIEVTRPTTQAILISTTGAKLIDILKSVSQAIGFAFSATKIKEVFRTVSQTISTAFGASRLVEAARAAAQAITISAATTRLIEITKTVSQTISTSLAASRLAELTRQVSQAIGVATIAGKLGEYSRNVSQGIAAAFGVGKLAELSRSVTQAIGVSASSERLIEFIKAASLAITVSVDGERLAELYRAISQGITFSATSQRLAEFIKAATQTITLSLDGERLAEINRAVSQSINLAFVVSKLSEFFRAASQQISTTFGVNKIFEAIRAAAQKITISSTTISILEIGRVASITINMGFNTVVAKIMEVYTSLQITVKTRGLVTTPAFNGIPLIALIVFGLMIYIGLTLGKRH